MNDPRAASVRVATYCDCGHTIIGFSGVLVCTKCGRCYAVSRMPLDVAVSPTLVTIAHTHVEATAA